MKFATAFLFVTLLAPLALVDACWLAPDAPDIAPAIDHEHSGEGDLSELEKLKAQAWYANIPQPKYVYSEEERKTIIQLPFSEAHIGDIEVKLHEGQLVVTDTSMIGTGYESYSYPVSANGEPQNLKVEYSGAESLLFISWTDCIGCDRLAVLPRDRNIPIVHMATEKAKPATPLLLS